MKAKTTISKDEVKRIARLAKLPLTKREIELFAPQLSRILDYVNLLAEVDTRDIEPTYHPSKSVENRFQENELSSDTLAIEEILKNAPKKRGGYIETEQVL